jgi:hypothetical protein
MSHKNGRYINCRTCGKVLYRSKSMLNRRFCNRKCYGLYMIGKPGPIISEAGKKRLSKARMGKKNPMWTGGAIRSFYRGFNWKNIRKEIYKRDYWTCQECETHCQGKEIQCHHIIPWRITKDNDIYNLITLCLSCHTIIENELRLYC